MPQRHGTVQVYTGDGKGKTTAALGLALRAAGHGLRTYMIQFMKGSSNYGELMVAESLPALVIEQSGRDTFVDRKNPAPEDIDLAKRGLEKARAAIASGEYDIVVLDPGNRAGEGHRLAGEQPFDEFPSAVAAHQNSIPSRASTPAS